MKSDAISNARVCGSNRNSSKKKRGMIKQGKSKHNKVDVRRDQRLSQVNDNVGEELEFHQSDPNGRERDNVQGNLTVTARKHEDETAIACNNESVSRTNGSSIRIFDHSSSSGSCSSSCCDIDERCLDDWEAFADALAAENRQTSESEHRVSESETAAVNCRYQGNSRAWSIDDTGRPRSLPGLLKLQHNQNQLNSVPKLQHNQNQLNSVPKLQYNQNQLNSEHCLSSGPPACPICCEDFDVTDLSFFPCDCGFQLCLFCHRRILEVDGRCPGCRKQYDSVNADAAIAVQTTHSYSKNSWL